MKEYSTFQLMNLAKVHYENIRQGIQFGYLKPFQIADGAGTRTRFDYDGMIHAVIYFYLHRNYGFMCSTASALASTLKNQKVYFNDGEFEIDLSEYLELISIKLYS